MPARVDDDPFRRQQRFDVREEKRPLLTTRDQSCGGRAQDERRALDLRLERRNPRVAYRASRPVERAARRLGVQSSHGDSKRYQLMNRTRHQGQRRGVQFAERTLGVVDASDEEQPADLEIARVCRVDVIAVRLECRTR
jgi:hypothetical protein